jgi:hypothetical protein
MTFFTFTERVVIPAVIAIMLAGGLAGLTLGCALVINHGATLRFIDRMNRWVSTREALAPLDARINVEPAHGRRPLLGAFLAVGGVLAVGFLLARLDFRQSGFAPGIDTQRLLVSSIVLETMKWVLVLGSAFATIIGALLLFAPARARLLERWLNRWHSSEPVVAAAEKMHTPLEPQVEAHPRASGCIIAVASLALTVAMTGLLLARLH